MSPKYQNTYNPKKVTLKLYISVNDLIISKEETHPSAEDFHGMQLFSDKVFVDATPLYILSQCVITEDGHSVEVFLLAQVAHDRVWSFKGVRHIALKSWDCARCCLTHPGKS